VNNYSISVENGYNRDYQNFRGIINATFDTGSNIGLSGTVYRFLFGKDIVVPDKTPGLGGPDGVSNIQVFLKVKNINQTTPLPITLYMFTLGEGVIQITQNSADIIDAPINSIDEVFTAPVVNMPYSSYKEMVGGGIFDELRKTAISSNHVNKHTLMPIQPIHPRISRGGTILAAGIEAAGGRSVGRGQLRMIKEKRLH